MDSEQEQEAEETILETVRFDTDGKGHESFETTMCHGIIYM